MRSADWLARQLPVGMTDDEFLMRFLQIFQTVSDTVLHQVDTLPHMFDPAVAPDVMVRLMGRWLGLEVIDSSLDDALQRRIVMEYSTLLQWRGTRRGMQRMLEVITGGAVRVGDSGGVHAEGEAPRVPPHVRITVEHTGWVTEEDLVVMIRSELPASVTFELRVGGDLIWPVDAPARERLSVRAGAAIPQTVAAGAVAAGAVSTGATTSAMTMSDIVGPGAAGPGPSEVPADLLEAGDAGIDARTEPRSDQRPDALQDPARRPPYDAALEHDEPQDPAPGEDR